MSAPAIKFALNHMACPNFSPLQLLDAAVELGVDAVELRNDVRDNSITSLETARAVAARAQQLGVKVLSINALYPFNVWNEERVEQARTLAALAQACGAQALVCCPLNSAAYQASEAERRAQLQSALQGLKPILAEYGLKGLIEPLGFPISSLRLKGEAVAAIQAVGGEDCFKLVHDTFHHLGAGERDMFPAMTGLVHASGVEDKAISFDDMLDAHRVFVGPADRLGNIEQIREMLDSGYSGYVSFEPFADELWTLADPVAAISASMTYIRQQLGS